MTTETNPDVASDFILLMISGASKAHFMKPDNIFSDIQSNRMQLKKIIKNQNQL